MKLSRETIIGLKRLCNKSLIPDDTFKELLGNCAELVSEEKKSGEQKIEVDAKVDAVKAAHASLLVLYVEAARHDVDTFMLKSILEEEYNLPVERVVPISETYTKHRSLTRQRLQTIGTNPPQIVDVRWRMDYSIKADDKRCFLEPIFYIDLITVTSYNTNKTVRFVCTIQNLEELVFALKNAVRHMSKLGNMLK